MLFGNSASSSEFKLAIRNLLINDSEVYSLVKNRVYGNHLQTPDLKTVEMPLVIIEFYLGDTSPTGGYQKVIFELWCYTRVSSGEALIIYDTCFNALQHQLVSVSGVGAKGYCLEMNRPTEGFNEMPRAYFARGRWIGRSGQY